MNLNFEINENIEINLDVEVTEGEIAFAPINLDTSNDWASYSLEVDGNLVAEHVSFGAVEVHDTDLLVQWYKKGWAEEYALCDDDEDIEEAAKEKLDSEFDSPDELYKADLTTARRTALTNWLAQEEPKIYRDDERGFGNEFHLTFVLPNGEYDPEGEYEVTAGDAVRMFFLYADDPTTEDYSSHAVIE